MNAKTTIIVRTRNPGVLFQMTNRTNADAPKKTIKRIVVTKIASESKLALNFTISDFHEMNNGIFCFPATLL